LDPVAFDGDQLADTPPDPMIDALHGATEDFVVLDGNRLPIPRDNIMSYWDSPRKTLSSMQIANARWTLATRSRSEMFLPVNAGGSSRVEAESLEVAFEGQDHGQPGALTEVQDQVMVRWIASRWSGGRQLRFSGILEAEVSLALPPSPKGRVRILFYGTRAPDYGCVQLFIGGEALGGSIDLYAPTVQPTGPIDLGEANLGEGPHKIRVEVVGRNERSRGWCFGLDAYEFSPIR
jgi:hypothetical protein